MIWVRSVLFGLVTQGTINKMGNISSLTADSLSELRERNRNRLIILSFRRHAGRYPEFDDYVRCRQIFSTSQDVGGFWAELKRQCHSPKDRQAQDLEAEKLREYLISLGITLSSTAAGATEFVSRLHDAALGMEVSESERVRISKQLMRGQLSVPELVDEVLAREEHKSHTDRRYSGREKCSPILDQDESRLHIVAERRSVDEILQRIRVDLAELGAER